MGNERFSMRGNSLVARLVGRLDAMNAEEVEQDVKSALASHNGSSIILDLEDLTYVSSAGLRVFLRLAKQTGKLSIENARSAVYEVLEMTGFSEMFEV
jgi:anti-anti-sigma factor